MRLFRRLCPAARFSCLLRLLTLENYELENDELSHKKAPSQLPLLTQAPSSTFRFAGRTIEANVRRVCRRLCPAAHFSRLLRLLALENNEFARDSGHVWPL